MPKVRNLLPILVFTLAACAGATRTVPGTPEQPALPPAPPLTYSTADMDPLAEMLRLEDRREYAPALLEQWASSQSEVQRVYAARAAGRIGERRASALLLGMLNDSSARVRAEAAFALGELADSSIVVVNALAQHVSSADSVGVEAISALGKLGARAPVEALLRNPATPKLLRDEALLTLWRFPRQPQTFDLVRPHLEANDSETRWRALYAITRGPSDPRATPDLIERTRDESPEVRAQAARGLRASTADSAGQRASAVQALLPLLGDPHPHVRINAVRSLAPYRQPEHAPAIVALLDDPDVNVAIAAAESLAEQPAAADALYTVACTAGEQPLAVRNAALVSLARHDRSRAVACATTWLQASDWVMRLYAVRLLGSGRDTTVLEVLRRTSDDPDGRVAATALSAYQALVDTAAAPYAFYIEKLAHPDPGVRAAAINGLRRRASAADQELFLAAYERAQQDMDDAAASAAIDALGQLARQNVPVHNTFFLRFSKPSNVLLHQRIVQQLGRGPWLAPKPIDTGRDLGFYRDVVRRLVIDSASSHPRIRIRSAPGDIVLELDGRSAPLTVHNMLTLADRRYFNNGRWHRVVPNFVLQDGDPRGDGSGGPGYAIRDEINRLRYQRGVLGMALSGPDTGGSQWFITHSPQPHLDGGYTIFGRVVEGMDIADRIVQDDPIHSIEVISR